jgi:uncharacterized protein YciI
MPIDVAAALEPCWYVEGVYGPDGAEARAPFRAAHVERLLGLATDGSLILAGSFPDVTASVFVVRAADEAGALALFRADPYLQNGVWVELTARPFVRVRA